MHGGTYKRNKIWWAWWIEKVKDPKTGKLRSKKCYESSQSTRRSDAITLLTTKMYKAETEKPRLDQPSPTYEEVRDLWLASNPNGERKKDGTRNFQGRKHLDAFFAGWQAKDIDISDITTLQNALRDKGLGESGIDHTVVSLRTMLNYAVRAGRLQRSQLPGRFPLFHPERKKEPVPIEEDVFDKVCGYLEEPFRSGFILSYHTGMRMTEVGRLRWENVNLAERYIEFKGISKNKSKKKRYVPLLRGTDKLLAKIFRTDDLVFPGFADRTLRAKAWREAAQKAGFVGGRKGIEMRFTRTTAARNLTNLGVPIPRVMQMMGHENIPTHMGYNVQDKKDLDLIRKLYDGKL